MNKTKRQHLKEKFEAATKIIAQWRGYRCRMLNEIKKQISAETLETTSPNEENPYEVPPMKDGTTSPVKKKIRTNDIGRMHELEVELEKKEYIHNEVLGIVQSLHDENGELCAKLAMKKSENKKLEEELQLSHRVQSERNQHHEKETMLTAQILQDSNEQCNALRVELAASATQTEKFRAVLAVSMSQNKKLEEELQLIQGKHSDATEQHQKEMMERAQSYRDVEEQCSTLTKDKKGLERKIKSLERQLKKLTAIQQSDKSLNDDECNKTNEETIRESLESMLNKSTESVLWEDIIGNEQVKDELRILPISGNLPAYLLKNQHPKHKNLGILFYGPPGTVRKSLLKLCVFSSLSDSIR